MAFGLVVGGVISGANAARERHRGAVAEADVSFGVTAAAGPAGQVRRAMRR
jgi:hypothetical protein